MFAKIDRVKNLKKKVKIFNSFAMIDKFSFLKTYRSNGWSVYVNHSLNIFASFINCRVLNDSNTAHSQVGWTAIFDVSIVVHFYKATGSYFIVEQTKRVE